MSKRIKTVRIKKPPTQQEKKMASIARTQAMKVVNKAIESKHYDGKLALAGENVDYNGSLYNVFIDVPAGTTIIQGTDQGEYIGEEIRPTHLSVRWSATSTLADADNLVTCVIMQAVGLFTPAANMANILQSTGNQSAPLSPFDADYDDRFRVLYRKTVALSQASETNKVFKVNIPYNKFGKVKFNTDTGAIEFGTIMIGWISDSAADVDPLIRAQWRLFYKDA